MELIKTLVNKGLDRKELQQLVFYQIMVCIGIVEVKWMFYNFKI